MPKLPMYSSSLHGWTASGDTNVPVTKNCCRSLASVNLSIAWLRRPSRCELLTLVVPSSYCEESHNYSIEMQALKMFQQGNNATDCTKRTKD